MTDPLVRLAGVSRTYKRGKIAIAVLRHLDLTIDKGDFLALMGPSGSGKTTLLNLIGGIDRPTEGRIEIGGVAIGDLSEHELAAWRARHVGFVFQFYNLLPILSAR
ncbi:MAG TPA: ATP-binding cassette domain-containing protein, partial [Gammaproteobacteria bacterium]|nr:ATP-binding cassette domain-containing protein [Gammaproteobacteria bacterium]